MNVRNVRNVVNVENECENAFPLKNNMNSGPQKNTHSFTTFIYHINHIHSLH
jgi:hypothetical protein